MTDKLLFRFNIGSSAICVEGGSGYGAPTMYDRVTVSVRQIKDNGKIGARQAITPYASRAEIAAIGISFLDVAHRMLPETTWARSDTVSSHGSQPRRIISLTAQESKDIDRFVGERAGELARDPAVAFEKLRRRMPTLQRLQYLLERVDDTLAHKIEMLLVIAEQVGELPFDVHVVPMAGMSEEIGPGHKH